MLARSSRHSALVALLVLAACKGKSEPSKPEADPAEVKKLAGHMYRNVPTPAALEGAPSIADELLSVDGIL